MCQKNLKAVNSRSFPKASMIEKSIAHHDHLMISEGGTNCPQGLGDPLPVRAQLLFHGIREWDTEPNGS